MVEEVISVVAREREVAGELSLEWWLVPGRPGDGGAVLVVTKGCRRTKGGVEEAGEGAGSSGNRGKNRERIPGMGFIVRDGDGELGMRRQRPASGTASWGKWWPVRRRFPKEWGRRPGTSAMRPHGRARALGVEVVGGVAWNPQRCGEVWAAMEVG